MVDAAGRPGRSIAWLDDLGYEPPGESVVNCDFAYAGAVLEPGDPDALWRGRRPRPARPRRQRAEPGRLRHPDRGWPLAGRPGWPARGPPTHRPDGLVPLGDAVCHVNPLYGHGMSAAALQVRALEQVLEGRARRSGDLAGLAREFFPGAFEATRAPWALAAGSDFLSSGTTGDFPDDEFANLMRLVQLGTLIDGDADAAALFVDLFGLRRPWSAREESPWRERLSPEPAGVAPA